MVPSASDPPAGDDFRISVRDDGGTPTVVVEGEVDVATAPALTANSTTGGPYTVTATGLGLTTPAASFSLTNTAGGPASRPGRRRRAPADARPHVVVT